MNLQQIHDMAADALAGEELQVRSDDDYVWCVVSGENITPFNISYDWRIKPTIEVNGKMMSKRQAKAAWEASGATSYEYTDMTHAWFVGGQSQPDFESNMHYRWQEPKWIYVNGEKIVRYGGDTAYMGYPVADHESGVKISKALKALIEIK